MNDQLSHAVREFKDRLHHNNYVYMVLTLQDGVVCRGPATSFCHRSRRVNKVDSSSDTYTAPVHFSPAAAALSSCSRTGHLLITGRGVMYALMRKSGTSGMPFLKMPGFLKF